MCCVHRSEGDHSHWGPVRWSNDLWCVRVDVCFSSDESLTSCAEFTVQKVSPRSSDQVRRTLCLTETCLVERDPATYNVVTCKPLCDVRFSLYSVSQKNAPLRTCGNFFSKRLGIFQPNFTCLLCVLIYARVQIFIQLPATLTKLCHIKRDHPVHIMCAKCPPLAETHAGIFWHFPQTVGNFWF